MFAAFQIVILWLNWVFTLQFAPEIDHYALNNVVKFKFYVWMQSNRLYCVLDCIVLRAKPYAVQYAYFDQSDSSMKCLDDISNKTSYNLIWFN